jgi:hypothetical protein
VRSDAALRANLSWVRKTNIMRGPDCKTDGRRAEGSMPPLGRTAEGAVVMLHHLSLQVRGDVGAFAQQLGARADLQKPADVITPAHCRIEVRRTERQQAVDSEAPAAELAPSGSGPSGGLQTGASGECEKTEHAAAQLASGTSSGCCLQGTPSASPPRRRRDPNPNPNDLSRAKEKSQTLSAPDLGSVPANRGTEGEESKRRWEPVAVCTPPASRASTPAKPRSKFFSSMLDLIDRG